jgi:ADP-heptose:LPS heptosyltransferase
MADIALGRRLRRERFDLAIDFHGGPRASLLTWLSGARRRIGYTIAGRSWMYTDRVERPRELRRRHSVLNQWDLLAPLGLPAPSPAANPLEMPLDADAVSRADARMAGLGVRPSDAIVVVHVSASSPFRRWPMSEFVETIAALAAPAGRRVLVTTGASERAAAAAAITGARDRLTGEARGRVLDGADLPLPELRALLERSALYIGGDSGPLHLAATTRVPIVAIYGPTPSERSAPWRDPAIPSAAIEVEDLPCRPCDQRTCAPGDFRCLTHIDAARVIAAAERLLAPAAATSRPSSAASSGTR